MVMNAFISEGDHPRSDQGGCSGRYGSRRGRGTGRRQRTRADGGVVVAEWPEGEDEGVGPARQ
jgi:hypothetical protein